MSATWQVQTASPPQVNGAGHVVASLNSPCSKILCLTATKVPQEEEAWAKTGL